MAIFFEPVKIFICLNASLASTKCFFFESNSITDLPLIFLVNAESVSGPKVSVESLFFRRAFKCWRKFAAEFDQEEIDCYQQPV